MIPCRGIPLSFKNTSYKYASVNAYNIYTLFGKNWTPITEKAILGLTYGQLGTVLMVLSVGFGGVLYFFGRKKHSGALSLATAFTFASLFTAGLMSIAFFGFSGII